MARIRSIKPAFFTNDTLADLSFATRLLFIGLWTVSDREGRVNDRPRKLKAEILPFDKVNIDKLLAGLQEHGFIERYESGGERFIQIVNFLRHQFPNKNEPASHIPAPSPNPRGTIAEPSPQGGNMVNGLGKGMVIGEGKRARASTRPPQKGKPTAESTLSDQVFMQELKDRFTACDFDYELVKWQDHLATKPPKGNFKNSLRNWLTNACKWQEANDDSRPKKDALPAHQLDYLEQRFRAGKVQVAKEAT